jgi:hypothetical protein
MFRISSRLRLHRAGAAFYVATLLLGQASGAAHAADGSNVSAFAGDWKYKQTCGYAHSAELNLTQTGTSVSGDWSDGTRLSGSDGSLKGTVRDGKLFVRYCGGDEHAGYAVCPSYDTRESDYFVRTGNDLAWYRESGEGKSRTFEKYVVLHAVSKGKRVVTDDHCTGQEN